MNVPKPEPVRDRLSVVAHPELDFPDCLTDYARDQVSAYERAIEECEGWAQDLDRAYAAPYLDVARWLEGRVGWFRERAAQAQSSVKSAAATPDEGRARSTCRYFEDAVAQFMKEFTCGDTCGVCGVDLPEVEAAPARTADEEVGDELQRLMWERMIAAAPDGHKAYQSAWGEATIMRCGCGAKVNTGFAYRLHLEAIAEQAAASPSAASADTTPRSWRRGDPPPLPGVDLLEDSLSGDRARRTPTGWQWCRLGGRDVDSFGHLRWEELFREDGSGELVEVLSNTEQEVVK